VDAKGLKKKKRTIREIDMDWQKKRGLGRREELPDDTKDIMTRPSFKVLLGSSHGRLGRGIRRVSKIGRKEEAITEGKGLNNQFQRTARLFNNGQLHERRGNRPGLDAK